MVTQLGADVYPRALAEVITHVYHRGYGRHALSHRADAVPHVLPMWCSTDSAVVWRAVAEANHLSDTRGPARKLHSTRIRGDYFLEHQATHHARHPHTKDVHHNLDGRPGMCRVPPKLVEEQRQQGTHAHGS